MNYKLPFVSIASLLLAATGAVGQNQNLVALAAQQLARQPALEAKIRQRVDLYGQPLVGTGEYRQLGEGPNKLLRLELKIQTASQVASLLQVSNDRFLWIRKDMLDRKSLSRVDLRRIREALQEQPTPIVDANFAWMALGGLSRLLQGLDENFIFGEPTPDQMQKYPVWVLEGQWKPERLAQLMPQHRAKILAGQPVPLRDLPPHVPERVRLVLGRDDVIPLFPYRVEYLRPDLPEDRERQENVEGASQPLRTIVLLELHEVRPLADLDPGQFIYQPGEQEMADVTDAFLHRLGLDKKHPGPEGK